VNSLAEARYRPVLGEIDPLAADIDFRSPNAVGMCEALDRLRNAGRTVAIVGPTSFAAQGYLILGYEAVERAYTKLDEVPTHLFFQQAYMKDYYGQIVSGQHGDEFRWHRAMSAIPLGPMRVRQLVESVLTPVANRLIDRWSGRHRVEFVAEFAELYPFDVISEMLAIPQEDRETVRGYVKTLFHLHEPEVARRAHDTMSDYIQRLAHERRRNPGHDLLTHFATAEVGGRRCTDVELADAVRFLYPAAGENTMNALGTLLFYVLSLPDVYERVRNSPDDRTAAIEESLRIRSSVQYMLRYIDKPLVIDGFEIPPDSYLMLANSSANRDPRYFENPTEFSLDRGSNKHISFGRGPNFCLGAHLARAEMRVMLDLLLARVDGLRLAPDQELVFQGGTGHGLRSLEIEFDALGPAPAA
jgi:cytochrome P450